MIKYTKKYNLYYIDDDVFIEGKDHIKKVKRYWFFDTCCYYDERLMAQVPIDSKIDKIMESNLTRG